ncbi:hypothetical protein NMY22_g17774 [Coprinellus aureogranulatus]|nr:hypothetical protein NMY22_g17774 [Coprinellus aureogranulatus]
MLLIIFETFFDPGMHSSDAGCAHRELSGISHALGMNTIRLDDHFPNLAIDTASWGVITSIIALRTGNWRETHLGLSLYNTAFALDPRSCQTIAQELQSDKLCMSSNALEVTASVDSGIRYSIAPATSSPTATKSPLSARAPSSLWAIESQFVNVATISEEAQKGMTVTPLLLKDSLSSLSEPSCVNTESMPELEVPASDLPSSSARRYYIRYLFLDMVGWMPWDIGVRKAKAAEFIERVDQSQVFGRDEIPLILQYDERYADMRPWFWPAENGVPIRPDELDRHRYTHYFKMPCCPCTYVNRSPFTETKVGLAQVVVQPGTGHCIGQYVAICSTQQCRYFASEASLPRTECGADGELISSSVRLDKPVKVMDPFTFVTGDTEEMIKRTGLRQMHILRDDSNTGLRGTNKLLKREDPEHFLKAQQSLETLLVKGLPADKFWDAFVQCTSCMYVMPRHHFPFYHHVWFKWSTLGLAYLEHFPPPKVPDVADFDDATLPGPATSDPEQSHDPAIGMTQIFARLAKKRQAQAVPTTPKARRKVSGP